MNTLAIQSARRPRGRRGFTLMEAALTTVIVGVGCVAMLQFLAAGTMANREGAELTTAVHLAGNIRESLAGLKFTDPTYPTHWGVESGETWVPAYDDVDDFDGRTFSPPLDGRRQSLGSNYTNWAQRVKVESVKPGQLTSVMAHLTLAPEQRPTSRVTVTVLHRGQVVYEQSWLVAYADPTVE